MSLGRSPEESHSRRGAQGKVLLDPPGGADYVRALLWGLGGASIGCSLWLFSAFLGLHLLGSPVLFVSFLAGLGIGFSTERVQHRQTFGLLAVITALAAGLFGSLLTTSIYYVSQSGAGLAAALSRASSSQILEIVQRDLTRLDLALGGGGLVLAYVLAMLPLRQWADTPEDCRRTPVFRTARLLDTPSRQQPPVARRRRAARPVIAIPRSAEPTPEMSALQDLAKASPAAPKRPKRTRSAAASPKKQVPAALPVEESADKRSRSATASRAKKASAPKVSTTDSKPAARKTRTPKKGQKTS